MSPTRVLVVHSADEGYGSDRILVLLVEVLRHRGHHVEVALPDDSGPGWLSATLRRDGIDVHVLPLAVVRRSYLSMRRLPAFAAGAVQAPWKVRRLMRERRLEIVYLNSLALMPLLFAPFVRRSRKLLHCHEILAQPRLLAIAQRHARRFVRRVFAVSQAVADALGDAANVVVVRNGIPELDAIDPEPAPELASQPSTVDEGERLTVLFVGRLSDWKGVDDFVWLADRIERPDTRFDIVGGAVPGDSERLALIEAACARSGGRLRYLGEVDDTSPLMRAADVLVVPSRRPDPYPTVVLEGMRAGCVVVATDGGGAAEAIEHGVDGVLVPMADRDTLARVVTDLIDDDDARAAIGAAATEAFRNRHGVDAFRARLEACFDEAGL